MPLEILPFSDEHLDAAAALLADAHARHRAAEPLLGRVDDYREQVARQWEREGSSGAIALRDGAAAGYLIGAPASNDNRGGTRIYADIAGHASADPELARDLFAAAAERWLAGLSAHQLGIVRFQRARVAALMGDESAALQYLEDALRVGVDNWHWHLHEAWRDLAPLHDHPRFVELVGATQVQTREA